VPLGYQVVVASLGHELAWPWLMHAPSRRARTSCMNHPMCSHGQPLGRRGASLGKGERGGPRKEGEGKEGEG